jgi:nucleotide-binding universal stress UspA family protein
MAKRINKKEKIEGRVYKTIVVPLDGSETAEAVLDLAKNLAVRSGSALALVHVCRPDQADYERMHQAYIERTADLIQHDIAMICTTTECRFEGVTATASSAMLKGDPAQEIVRYAEEQKASTILMATHGRSKAPRSVMSDIAFRVMRNSMVPVCMLRTLGPDEIVCAEWPPTRVLVPLDGSDKAEKVIPYAVEYAKLFDAEMVLLRVCEEPQITADYPEGARQVSWDEHVKHVRSHYQGQCSIYLETVKDRLEGEGIKISIESLLGNPAEQIIEYIRQNRCDLIAMTTYGRSGIGRLAPDSPVGRWFFSNVTEQVLAASSRGMLVVRG